jgi:hypothetical protein
MPRLRRGAWDRRRLRGRAHADGVAYESLDDLGAAHSALPDDSDFVEGDAAAVPLADAN